MAAEEDPAGDGGDGGTVRLYYDPVALVNLGTIHAHGGSGG